MGFWNTASLGLWSDARLRSNLRSGRPTLNRSGDSHRIVRHPCGRMLEIAIIEELEDRHIGGNRCGVGAQRLAIPTAASYKQEVVDEHFCPLQWWNEFSNFCRPICST